MPNKRLILILMFLVLCAPILAQANPLDNLLADYVAEDDLSVVLYVRYGDEDAIAVRGLADYYEDIPSTVDGRYRIASVTKPFVATLMLQLVDKGLVKLDDPIANYLPADIIDNLENAETATIRQLLQMTSGIYNYLESDAFNEVILDDPWHVWTAAETITYAYEEEAYFPAGEGYYYSNTNYNLVQLIIESVSGHTLREDLTENIFKPLGMDSCDLEVFDQFADNTVRGYEMYDDLEDVTEVNDGVGLGDGGIICTASDLAKFLPGLVNDGLLTDESFDQMLTVVDDGEGGLYGLGIVYEEDDDLGTLIWHNGLSSGFQSITQYIIDSDLVVVVLTNDEDSEIVADLAYDAMSLALETAESD